MSSGKSHHNHGSDSGLNSPDHLTEDDETVPPHSAESNAPFSKSGSHIDRSQSNGNKTRVIGANDSKVEIIREVGIFHENLGGYRNKLTGQIYHHKAIQTVTLEKQIKTARELTVDRHARETQTVQTDNRSQQTAASKCTQTNRPGIYISIGSDRTLEPRPYVTSGEAILRAIHQVIVIQKYWRRYKAGKTVKRMVKDKDSSAISRSTWKENEPISLESFSKKLLDERNINSKQDYERIYNNLKRWKEREVAAIESAMLTGKLKRLAFVDLVRKEAQILAIIDVRKRNANEMKQKRITADMLKYITEPKSWRCSNRKTYEVVTPSVSKLRKLRNFYYALDEHGGQCAEINGRIETLASLIEFFKQEESEDKLCQEILKVINREIELIALRSSVSSITALRHRIRVLLLEYIFVTYFRENGTLHPTQPIDSSVSQCPSCGHHRPVRDFLSSAAVRLLAKCQACRAIDNRSRQRLEYGIYRQHLRWIRKEEELLGSTTGIACILQESDICYLVDKIWHRRSALSEVADPMELVLCRWRSDEEWSPWNCVLLTENEAKVHKMMGIAEENYGVVFVQKVKHKQTLGKRYFGQLSKGATKQRSPQQQSIATNMFITVKPIN